MSFVKVMGYPPITYTTFSAVTSSTALVTNSVQKVNATSPTTTLVTDLSYIVASSGVTYTAWSSKETQLAVYSTGTSTWSFTTPVSTWVIRSETNSTTYRYNGTWYSSTDWSGITMYHIVGTIPKIGRDVYDSSIETYRQTVLSLSIDITVPENQIEEIRV